MKIIINQPQAFCKQGKRQNQEDACYPEVGKMTPDNRCFVLCDGMGGHDQGEVASMTVSQTMGGWLNTLMADEHYMFEVDDLENAIAYAYNALDSLDSENAEGIRKMGTTLALLLLADNGCVMAHIGDSRIYHLRPKEGEICYRSEDHSLVNDLVKSGELTLEEARTSPSRHMLTRAMQPHQPLRSKADWKLASDVRPGDCFLLCSDGLLEKLTDDMLMTILQKKQNDYERMCMLQELSVSNRDNHTCILISVKEVKMEDRNSDWDVINKKKISPGQIVWQKFVRLIRKN